MSFLTDADIEEIKESFAEQKKVFAEYYNLQKRLLVPGTVLCWRTRGHLQTGTLDRICYGDDVFIQNHKTLKTVRINLHLVDWGATARLSKDVKATK